MPRRLHVEPHLTIAELGQRYRQARDPVARSHLQIVWLAAQGRSRAEITAATGYHARWISTLLGRYNQAGAAALGDRRHTNPGGQYRLTAEQQQRLAQALEGPAPDGGLWTGPKVAAWIAAETGQPTHPQLGWRYLVRLGYRPLRPRPRHSQADPEAQAAFPKPS
jgi:transposase